MCETLVPATYLPPLPPGLVQAPEDRDEWGGRRSSPGPLDRVRGIDPFHRASLPWERLPGAERAGRVRESSSLPFPPVLGERCWFARYRTNRTSSTSVWGARRTGCHCAGASEGGSTGTGRSVHCHGNASKRPFCPRRTTQGILWRQKTRQTRPAWPQAGLSSAWMVARAP
jgi:hypothetical protein